MYSITLSLRRFVEAFVDGLVFGGVGKAFAKDYVGGFFRGTQSGEKVFCDFGCVFAEIVVT